MARRRVPPPPEGRLRETGLSAPADPGDPLFAKGLEEFRAGRFFEAHEEWETLWMTSQGNAKVFLQALIQIAAACVHMTRGNGKPGIRLLALADEKLARVAPEFGGIHTDFLRKEIGRAMKRVDRGEAPGDVAKALQL